MNNTIIHLDYWYNVDETVPIPFNVVYEETDVENWESPGKVLYRLRSNTGSRTGERLFYFLGDDFYEITYHIVFDFDINSVN
jgi:hypothetical protein